MRIIETEWLDSLPASDPRAEHSRRDLRRVNTIMGNARHIASALRPHWREGMRIADLGAGDGSLTEAVQRRLPGKVQAILVDKTDGLDVLDFLRESGPRLDAIICNLFLHHLDGDLLSDVLALAAERGELAQPIVPGLPDLLAEVALAARHEQARSIGDALLRRTRLGLLAGRSLLVDGGGTGEPVQRVAEVLARELAWDSARMKMEMERFALEASAEGLSPQ